mmetsp:Transcript_26667/g.30653  ORF Transcript_26667/g.30653 Transcript_26667/m.30653 type:complete len:87 (-) Transcript_26667:2234-2494(-)
MHSKRFIYTKYFFFFSEVRGLTMQDTKGRRRRINKEKSKYTSLFKQSFLIRSNRRENYNTLIRMIPITIQISFDTRPVGVFLVFCE